MIDVIFNFVVLDKQNQKAGSFPEKKPSPNYWKGATFLPFETINICHCTIAMLWGFKEAMLLICETRTINCCV
jgi:hypothetical protein